MSIVSPFRVLQQVAEAVPESCKEHLIIIGSLAAGFHYFGKDPDKAARTKDVDCVLDPFHLAVDTGRTIAETLLSAGWKRKTTGDHAQPGNELTPEESLPAVRLYPPGVDPEEENAWFLELLTVPESMDATGRSWTRLELSDGHFGLPSFRFLTLTAFKPLLDVATSLQYARPEMMALANLLEHPEIGPERMSALIGERAIKRSNKDLGRVIALAYLADMHDYRPWAAKWLEALKDRFPDEGPSFADRSGQGLQALMDSPDDFEEAHFSAINGLLSDEGVDVLAFRASADRLMGEAMEELKRLV